MSLDHFNSDLVEYKNISQDQYRPMYSVITAPAMPEAASSISRSLTGRCPG